MSKRFIILFILVVGFGCQSTEPKNPNSSGPEHIAVTESADMNASSGKINIEQALMNNPDDYFMTLLDSTLSLCCVYQLYNPFMSFDYNSIRKYLKGFSEQIDGRTVIYQKTPSQIKVLTWKSEQPGEPELFFGPGALVESSVNLPNGVKIGMSKEELMSSFFVYQGKTFHEIKQISVCEDERGEWYTKYKFVEGKLAIIEFGNQSEK